MIDLHYDLLMNIYLKVRDNKLNDIQSFCKSVYREDNIKGGIITIYYMPEEEMLDEFGIKSKDIDVISWFQKVKSYLLDGQLLLSNEFVLGLEGCRYLNHVDDLDSLYHLGVRMIQPVWNEQNKYGSGIGYEGGLTPLGTQLVMKAMTLGMGIDLSHANEQTFFDILAMVKKYHALKPLIFVSHSNVRALCNRERNLTDKQLLAIKEVDGIIGLMTHRNFIKQNNSHICQKDMEDYFVEHISYIKKLFGDVKNIAISTDDMNFHPDSKYHHLNLYPLETIAQNLKATLQRKGYTLEEINDILYTNSSKLIKKLQNNKKEI